MRPDELTTPAYVYDLGVVRDNHAALSAALPAPSRLYYSLKANPHPVLVAALAGAGCGAELCSTGELAAALSAGVPPELMLYTGPGRRDDELAEAVKGGVTRFSADSPHALDQLDRVAGGLGAAVDVLLRVNDKVPAAGQGLTMTGVASQFGADAEWVEAQPERFRSRPNARIAGFHLYMGSNIDGVDALAAQFTTAIGTARRLHRLLGGELRLLNLGGGFGAPFGRAGERAALDGLAGRVEPALDAAFPGWRDRAPLVAFESGRYLTATAGRLYTRVLDVKTSHGRPVVVLESGIHHLGGMSGLRRLPPLTPDLVTDPTGSGGPAEPAGEPLAGAIVAGPLCTPLDTWARSADLPALRPGDLVCVPNVGAYGLTASLLAFLGHPAPSEVVVDAGRVVDVSRLTLVRDPV